MPKPSSLAQAKRAQQGQANKKRQMKALRPKSPPASSALKAYRLARLDTLLARAEAPLREAFAQGAGRLPAVLFLSFTDGTARARVMHATGATLVDAWQALGQQLARETLAGDKVRFARLEWVESVRSASWQQAEQLMARTKRNYFRYGIALDADFRYPLLEQEINANAVLYAGHQVEQARLNPGNYRVYTRARFGKAQPVPEPTQPVALFTTRGLFMQAGAEPVAINGHQDGVAGRDVGRRAATPLDAPQVTDLIVKSSRFLAEQVNGRGHFVYGIHPCFDRDIDTYNTLRHASTTYAMLEAWEVTREPALKKAIERSIGYLTGELIRTYAAPGGERLAYLTDQNNEIKLGGNAVSLLALVKYTELTEDERHLPLMEGLALGIRHMQDPRTGQMVHVLNADDLSVKEAFRIIYYDGEAAFGLMRLYGLTGDERWLETVVTAFDYFIEQKHWQIHDHWLSYCVNELTLYRPEERYFRFGIQNVAGHLDFVIERITTFPTLLELMMAAHKMLLRLQQSDEHRHLLKQIDQDKFYRALETRARHLLNGFFFPEVAMFFKNPQRILGSFFIRHHGFRVRIDDVEHYLSGFVAYLQHYLPAPYTPGPQGTQRKVLAAQYPEADGAKVAADTVAPADAPLLGRYSAAGVVSWGGDVNLGRRQHYRSEQLGYAQALAIPELKAADLTVVNLECVVATIGQQGVIKGEGGPYYYRARPEMLSVLAEAGVNLVTVANNHSGDYGPDALMQQQSILSAVGIASAGSGHNRDAALAPAFSQAGNLRVAVFSIDATQHRFSASDDGPGAAYLPPDQPERWRETLQPLIDQAKQQADLALVAVHWGANHAAEPDAAEVSIGHAIIDAGADAILGASAHRLQGIEVYQNKPIIHDAGDLLFDSVRSNLAASGVFQLGLISAGVSWVRFVPIGVGFGFSKRLVGEQAKRLTDNFISRCQRMGTPLQHGQDDAYLVLGKVEEAIQPRRTHPPSYNLEALTQWQPTEVDEMASVPEEYAIEPVVLGGLTLLGIRVHPASLTRRRMLWVETWWRCDDAPEENLRLDYRAFPETQHSMPVWGRGMDHDPGDWLQPTRGWKPGKIYRDFFGLRPPQFKQLVNDRLRLEVRVLGRREQSNAYVYPHNIELNIPQLVKSQLSRQYRTDFSGIDLDIAPGQAWTADQLAAITGGQWLVAPPEGWFVRSVINIAKNHIGVREDPLLYVAHTNRDRAFHEQYSNPPKSLQDRHELLPELAPKLAGAIISKPVAGLPEGFPLLQVADPIRAMMELGFAARQRYQGPVIAVTGVAGKSSTVSLIGMLFEPDRVLKSLENYNSRVGAPVQLASLAPDHQAAILEVSSSALWMQKGPITRQVKPNIAIVTEIGYAHAGRVIKTTEDTARYKSRIYDGLTDDGVAVVGEHLMHFDMIMEKASKHASRIVTYGSSDQATVQVLEQKSVDGKTQMMVRVAATKLPVVFPFTNPGMVRNGLSALAVAHVLGMDISTAAGRIAARWAPLDGRGAEWSMDYRHGQVAFLDDAYNANPLSMKAMLIDLAQRNLPGRKHLVLADMLELGESSSEQHRELVPQLCASGVVSVTLLGSQMQGLAPELKRCISSVYCAENQDQSRIHLSALIEPSDLVVAKGSNKFQLSKLLKSLGELSYLVVDESGRTLLKYQSDLTFKPGSLVKLVTAMVVLDYVKDLSQPLTVEAGDLVGGSGANLLVGDTLTVEDALHNLLIPASNRTAQLLARSVGHRLLSQSGQDGEAHGCFMKAMNQKARELGAHSTQFANSSGLNHREMYSSTSDMALLALAALEYPLIERIIGMASHELVITGRQPRTLRVKTRVESLVLPDSITVAGGKTGTLVGTAENLMIKAVLNGKPVLAVLMQQGGSRWNLMSALLNEALKVVETEKA